MDGSGHSHLPGRDLFDRHRRSFEHVLVVSGVPHERGYFVGASNGKLYEYALVAGVSPIWTEVGRPGSSTLTGHITAFSGLAGSERRVMVAATSTIGELWLASKTLPSGSWTWSLLGTGFAAGTRPLTSTVDTTETIWSVFAASSTNTVHLLRGNGSSWPRYELNNPAVAVCGSLDAAQATNASGEFRLIVFCTRQDADEGQVRYLYSTSPGATTFYWGFVTLPGGALAARASYTIAAVDRPSGTAYAIDGWAVGTNQHVFVLTWTGGSSITVTDRGSTGETSSTTGGTVAGRTGEGSTFDFSRLAFVGTLNGASYLYGRTGRDTSNAIAWTALGAGTPVSAISGAQPPHTESFIAEWQGRILAASIVRGGAAPPPSAPGPS